MVKATSVFWHKNIYPDGALVEMKVWAVPKSQRTPEGFKYSLVYINPDGQRLLGYDNAEGKGHHRHEGKRETPSVFVSIDQVIQQFLEEVQVIRRGTHEG